MNDTLQQIQDAYLNGLAEEAQLLERLDAIRKARPMQLGGIQALQLHAQAEAAAEKAKTPDKAPEPTK